MKNHSKLIKTIVIAAITLVLVAFTIIRLKSNKETTDKRVYQYDKEKPVSIQVDTVKLVKPNTAYVFSGTFEPNKESKISAEVQGKINAVLVDVGNVVYKGQTLIQLDNSLLKLQEQNMDVQIEGLEKDVKRYTVLAKADAVQGIQLEKSEMALKSAKIQKAITIEQINKTNILAPFNGIVTAKFNEEGSFAAPGVPLLQITDISNLKFTINIAEADLVKFKPNENYSITVDLYPEISLQGKIIMIASKANQSNTFPVQFSVNNTSDLKIKSGMFGKAHLKFENQEKAFLIPSSAIVGTNIQPQVYVVKNGKAKLQNITVSNRIQDKVFVSAGLTEGDWLVTNGFINLFDGANVIIK